MKSQRRGFSLMEVLIAMGIAGVGMCGILTALPMIAFQVQKVRMQVSGKQLANLAEETICLQKWCEPTNTDLAWLSDYDNPVGYAGDVPVDFPIAIDPWSEIAPQTPATPPADFWDVFFTPQIADVHDDVKWAFLDPTAIKISAHPASERPELTYVSLNNSIAPDRSDDYSWFYTVLPRVKKDIVAATDIPATEIDAYHVSVVVSRKRAFDDDATHRVYEIKTLTPGVKADKITLAGQASLGKYVAVLIPISVWSTSGDNTKNWYGCCFRWYKVITSRENTATGETSVLLHRLGGNADDNLPPMPPVVVGSSFLLTIDSVINVKSFDVQ